MSGIVGSYGEIDATAGKRMLERLAHRGPDGAGSAGIAGNWIGARSLALHGAGSAPQPFVSADGQLSMVADGEVYNAQALRQALPDQYVRTRASTEVIVHLFDTQGPEAFARLDGMFAALIAGVDGRFVAVRDPLGIKPLYWSTREGRTLFASELGAYDHEWLPGAEFFPPGHYWTPEDGLVRFAEGVPRELDQDRFPHSMEPGADIPPDILTGVRAQLVAAVENQMSVDVEIGSLLSGGLDSSLIAAIAARWCKQHGTTLKTFAVGLEGSPDLVAARKVADFINAEHNETTYTPEEAMELLPEVVRALENFDPATVRSSVSNYIVARTAAEQVKVVLTGEGADEIFGGYEYFKTFDTEEALQQELVQSLLEGHNGGFQRVDRMTMAHGIEGRVPFAANSMVELGFSIPAGWKFAGDDQPEKRILREAFAGWLPDSVLWRKKAQFGEGSGAGNLLPEKVASMVSEAEFERERDDVEPPLRTREEVAYYRMFEDALAGVRPHATIGRYAATDLHQ